MTELYEWISGLRVTLFSELDVWCDSVARSGSENMAVDQVLYESGLNKPLLRFYQWSKPTVSVGYFEKLSDTTELHGTTELEYVRRWTGGGIVDHREDETYTLFVPAEHPLASIRGSTSYAAIHKALRVSLVEQGVACQLVNCGSDSDSRACFEKPVAFDIIGTSGEKLAGAGQKRGRHGLLHQGSVQGVRQRKRWREYFILALADRVKEKDINPDELGDVSQLVRERYGAQAWTQKRC